MDRREVLKALAGMTAALLAPRALPAQTPATAPAAEPITRDRWGERLPQRRLGKGGPFVTMLGLGGHHITAFADEAGAQKTIEAAIAGGVRFFEMGLAYGDGLGEERYGRYLTPKYRDSIFLMSKATASNAVAARQQLDDSLRRLKTDYLDLWQMHNISTMADADRRTAAVTGALDVLVEAREKGRVKHIGFTGHLNPAVHGRVLDRLKERNIQVHTVQMPVNVADPSYTRSFILQVLPRALDLGMGVIAMKTMANGGFFGGAEGLPGDNPRIIPDRMSVAEALHFVWSLPVSVTVCGVHNPEMLQEKIDAARTFKPLDENQRAALVAKVADLAGITVEVYKSDTRRSPEARARDAARAATRPAGQASGAATRPAGQ
jgi:aryl-alcohol dehydrogenase-like predicted oxidoreductase